MNADAIVRAAHAGDEKVVVAIDGPAGSGKSSVSRAAASVLGFGFLDTGAAYRALGWLGLDAGAALEEPEAVLAVLDELDYTISLDPDDRWVRVGERDVTHAIREPRVSAAASLVAKVPAVRERFNAMFREMIAETESGIVVEGRDITTIVAPDADVRVLLTASPEVRAARRAAELGRPTDASSVAETQRAIGARDAQDRQTIDFMTAAEGVLTLDSTELDFDETVEAVVRLARAAQAAKAAAQTGVEGS